MKKLVYQGSVKDIYELDGDLEFNFSDRYSIFDWGEMPDHIPQKGQYLNQIAKFFFDYLSNNLNFQNIKYPSFLNQQCVSQIKNSDSLNELQEKGLNNHYIEKISKNNFLSKKMNIINPVYINSTYDYSEYSLRPSNTVIPLEVVFRLGTPTGSSLLKRADSELLQEHKINSKIIVANEFLDNIIVEFYTKLEPIDRLLSTEEAMIISGLNKQEFNNLIEITKILSIVLYNKFEEVGFKLWDGKFEFACGSENSGNRDIILIDSIGPDELRLTKNSIPFSKEILRQFYLTSEWYKDLESAKKRDSFNFKSLTSTDPNKLSKKQIQQAEYIYKTIAESLENGFCKTVAEIEQDIKSFFKQVVIFGKGGREHALAKYLSQHDQVQVVYVIPGNPGMSGQKIITSEVDKLNYLSFCKNKNIDLAIIGPEALLKDGLSDQLEELNIPSFAPSKEAAKLETSKAFSKNLMHKYNIPTAEYEVFTDIISAHAYIETLNWNKFVIKQSSLASGKGVIICDTKPEALVACSELLKLDSKIIVEEFLEGKEVSYFALCLDEEFQFLAHACDYKRLNNNNVGPNTGGMGCYAPAFWLSTSQCELINDTILKPTLKAMVTENLNFKGVLFIGLMMTKSGPKVLEYNVRFGDPETQTFLPLIESGFLECIEAIAKNDVQRLKAQSILMKKQSSVHIVKASKGYPGNSGKVIELNKKIEDEIVISSHLHLYYAGVREEKKTLLTNGGRVLGITSIANDLKSARLNAYRNLPNISFEGEHFREDIGL